MSQQMSEQAVAQDSEAVVEQPVEEISAQDELDSLLEKFDEETKPKEEPKTDQDLAALRKEVQELRAAGDAKQNEADLQSAVAEIKGESSLSDKIIRGFIEGEAVENSSIREAFEQRFAKPKAWTAAKKLMKKTLAEEQTIDSKATQDRDAVASAVSNAQTSTDADTPDFNSMTDQEFAMWKAGH